MQWASLARRASLVTGVAALVFLPSRAAGQANPYRGLWVGSVSLEAVNEVAVPLDAKNVPIAPDPRVPTRTYDRADLRILLHVNGAGQANLLKDVAVLNRAYNSTGAAAGVIAKESDLALVTDPRAYASYPPQPAYRIGSAAFDFGDAKATEALDVLVEDAVQRAATFAMGTGLAVATQADRVQARNAAVAAMLPALQGIVSSANVANAFSGFVTSFNSGALNTIAADPSSSAVSNFQLQAVSLRDASFYGDTRELDMVNAVVAAVQAADPTNRQAAAHNTASAFADVGNLYQRFVSGQGFGRMMLAAADEAAVAAKEAGATAASILEALRAIPESTAATTMALQTKVHAYSDTRASGAVETALGAMAAAAYANAALAASEIRLKTEQAGRDALSGLVARYPLPVQTPTIDYNAFVTSSTFIGAGSAAAAAAANAAIQERAVNPLYTLSSLYAAAKVAAANALQAAYGAAARALRAELPLTGTFAPGSGDPRAIATLANPSDLGAPGLQGRIYLPASHPTNPFRHRRHPDHTTGYDIQRVIRFDFDAAESNKLESAGYGVDRICGTYREEIFGLHKPLGPDPDTNPIGLRTEGRFELNRISTIDTLNTQ